ncbi:hypothetical protein NDR87_27660 [Nocardia sp. CDC159]|uniref:Uncharacterized protein n=1 Tax=Nocardia pulmonis TaxID=2951408 RepID=A0A9X2EAD4_9NOCA|nr:MULTISPECIES: deaminase domain-containing protein [Nocardia]MCM6777269.1 hypothetical protein [Nocardia pulmonis]MCM6790154.1 hypothetical protein [Nocardia sp. CDC159]
MAQFQRMATGPTPAREGATGTANERRVYTFYDMTPAGASRRLERVLSSRDMVATAQSIAIEASGLDPIARVIPPSTPSAPMPVSPPSIPEGTQVVPQETWDNGTQRAPLQYEPNHNTMRGGGGGGGGGGGTSPGGNNRNTPGQSGGGGQNGSTPPPAQRWVINPPGHYVIWENDHPRWEDGREVHIFRDENGNITGFGYPEPVPGTQDDARAENKPAQDHSDAGSQPSPSTTGNGGGSTPVPSQGGNEGPRPNTTAPTPADPEDANQEPNPAPPTDAPENEDPAPADPAAPAESDPAPQPNQPAELPPEPEPEEPQPKPEEPQEERGIGQPGFLESLIPGWGSGRAAIDDFQNGRWVWGIFNTIMAISDLFLIGTIAKVGAKALLKLGKMLLESGAVKKAIADAAAAAAKKAVDAAKAVVDGVTSAWNKAGEMVAGIFGGGKKKAAEEAKRAEKAAAEAQREAAERQWKEAAEERQRRLDEWKRKKEAGEKVDYTRRSPEWKPSGDGFDDLRSDIQRMHDSSPNISHTRTLASGEFEAADGSKINLRASSAKEKTVKRERKPFPDEAREPVDNPNRYEHFTVGEIPRNADAELKILETLRSQLKPGASGKLRMVVDLPSGDSKLATEIVCDSCRGVLNQFRHEFPGISVEIRDMYGRIITPE